MDPPAYFADETASAACAAAPRKRQGSFRSKCFVLFSVAFSIWIDIYLYSCIVTIVAAPHVRADGAVTPVSALYASFLGLAYGLGMLVSAPLSGYVSRTRAGCSCLLVTGEVLRVAGVALAAPWDQPQAAWLLSARVCEGMSAGLHFVVGLVLLNKCIKCPVDMGIGLGLFSTATVTAIFLPWFGRVVPTTETLTSYAVVHIVAIIVMHLSIPLSLTLVFSKVIENASEEEDEPTSTSTSTSPSSDIVDAGKEAGLVGVCPSSSSKSEQNLEDVGILLRSPRMLVNLLGIITVALLITLLLPSLPMMVAKTKPSGDIVGQVLTAIVTMLLMTYTGRSSGTAVGFLCAVRLVSIFGFLYTSATIFMGSYPVFIFGKPFAGPLWEAWLALGICVMTSSVAHMADAIYTVVDMTRARPAPATNTKCTGWALITGALAFGCTLGNFTSTMVWKTRDSWVFWEPQWGLIAWVCIILSASVTVPIGFFAIPVGEEAVWRYREGYAQLLPGLDRWYGKAAVVRKDAQVAV